MKHAVNLRLFSMVLIASNTLAIAGLSLGLDPSFYNREDGLLENLQALVLLATMIVALWQHWVQRADVGLAPLFLALVCFSGLLRELDVERYDIPQILILLGSGLGKRILLGALWLGFFAWAIRRRREVWSEGVGLLGRLAGRCMLLAPALILVAGLLDKKILPLPYPVFFEELLELNAYAVMLLAALTLRQPDP